MKAISEILATFFKDNPEKITLWLFTANPMFGKMTPAELILRNPLRAEKLIKSLYEEGGGNYTNVLTEKEQLDKALLLLDEVARELDHMYYAGEIDTSIFTCSEDDLYAHVGYPRDIIQKFLNETKNAH